MQSGTKRKTDVKRSFNLCIEGSQKQVHLSCFTTKREPGELGVGRVHQERRFLYFGRNFFSCPSSSIPTLLIHSFIHSLINYTEFIPNHTNLSRLCFAKHNAAHIDEHTMPHTMFRHHNFNKISQFF